MNVLGLNLHSTMGAATSGIVQRDVPRRSEDCWGRDEPMLTKKMIARRKVNFRVARVWRTLLVVT